MSIVSETVTLLAGEIPGGFAPQTAAEIAAPHAPTKVYVFHSRVTTAYTPDRFVIVSGGTGARSVGSFSGAVDTNQPAVRLTITAVLPKTSAGTPGPRAEWLAERCETVLVAARIALPGRKVSRFRHDLTRFMGSDEGLASLISAYYVADFTLIVS